MKSKIKGFLVALMYMAIGFSVQIIVSIIGGIIIAVSYTVKQGADSLTGAGKEDTTVMIAKQIMGNMNYILLASSITTILIFMLIYKLRKKKLSEELRFKKTKASNYWVALLLGVSVYLFNIGFISLLSKAGLFKGSFYALEKNMSFIGESNIFLTILVVGIVAPFAEELLFRGIIYKTLSKSMSIPAVIIIQGVLFGVYHMILVQAIYATLLGILFGYVTYKTKSLWPAIIMHMVNNTVSTIASLILGESLETVFSLIIVLSLGFAITAVGTFLIKKNNPKIIEDTKVGIEL
ncbi:CPBP family intramembrane metalloprotease [Clostridium gasigenes]|uniref:CPBP family intramembrane glutamic endopeptidase n=1 Tax=Clostridium gasigenes TaxID=94869 RepID=UPI0014382AF1|nr:CPBP family intramembrane glutamic endopeptidase [Clostridium gasigenes]MBU3135193.1 CPBP family intramembrane metalloprotease [Clostridium gasigenes]NKF05482.1 CPBP family intramembrane metalloprotease [Clostridium gasigenes]QSW18928.1 CPBP family intramembrane metalloprotease [Clostridium gasigenes]